MNDKILGIICGGKSSGKGHYSKIIKEGSDIKHLSSGDMLRNSTIPEAEKVREIIATGALAPDDFVLNMIFAEAIKHPLLLFDGLPRNLYQAPIVKKWAAGNGYKIKVIRVNASEDVATKRMLKRAGLEGRSDDNLASFKNSWHIFTKETLPTIEDLSLEFPVFDIYADTNFEDLPLDEQKQLVDNLKYFYFY